ncbi:putative reverse transcriptase domain-containing protein [Tanacetum coccineum]
MAPTGRCNSNNSGSNLDITAIIAQQLQGIIPQIVTQVTNNVNNANGNEGNRNGGAIMLTRWIEKMESVMDISGCVNNQKVRYASCSLFNKALTWWNTQIQARGHEAALGMTWEEFKAFTFVVDVCIARFHELVKLVPHLVMLESKRIDRYIHGLVPQIRGMIQATQPTTIQSAILKAGALTDEAVRCGTLSKSSEKRKEKPGHIARDCRSSVKPVAPINAARIGNNQRVCYECGSPNHFRNTCPKLNRAPTQVGNRLTIEGNQNLRNNGNQTRGKAFNGNAVEDHQDSNIMTGTFSLSDHFATILFDSGANFSFITTKFVPLLNVTPSIIRPGYVIEVANDKKVETDRIIRRCILELGNS